jgi:hypothetical protein
VGDTTVYTDDGTISTGKTLYTDAYLTSPYITSFSYIHDYYGTTIIYNYNGSTGVVGSSYGVSC